MEHIQCAPLIIIIANNLQSIKTNYKLCNIIMYGISGTMDSVDIFHSFF